MASVSSSNGPPSAEMSLIMQQMQRYDRRDEARFLQQQAADAQAAIKQTLVRMRDTSQEAANVRWWTQHYPWCAVGGAGLVGFVAAMCLQSASRRQEPPAHQSGAASSSVFSGVLGSLLAMARSALISAIIDALQTPEQEPAAEPQPSAAPPSYAEH